MRCTWAFQVSRHVEIEVIERDRILQYRFTRRRMVFEGVCEERRADCRFQSCAGTTTSVVIVWNWVAVGLRWFSNRDKSVTDS
jgi:hypothetical protein